MGDRTSSLSSTHGKLVLAFKNIISKRKKDAGANGFSARNDALSSKTEIRAGCSLRSSLLSPRSSATSLRETDAQLACGIQASCAACWAAAQKTIQLAAPVGAQLAGDLAARFKKRNHRVTMAANSLKTAEKTRKIYSSLGGALSCAMQTFDFCLKSAVFSRSRPSSK